jgi:hypothetical protein
MIGVMVKWEGRRDRDGFSICPKNIHQNQPAASVFFRKSKIQNLAIQYVVWCVVYVRTNNETEDARRYGRVPSASGFWFARCRA